MKKLGVLVVGPGWVAGEHIKCYLENNRTELRTVALARNSASQKKRAKDYFDKFGLENVRLETDWQSAIQSPEIDIVSICSISKYHYEMVAHAMKLGKHVLVEKPVCFTEKELDSLKRLHAKSGAKAAVCHVVRYYPALVNIKRLVDNKKIGTPYYIEADYWHEVIGAWKCKKETAGSSLLMGGCHAVDMIFHMIGFNKEPVSVSAMATRATRRLDFDYEPNVAGIIKFKTGEIAKIGSSLESALPYKFHLQIMGSKGAVVDNKLYKIINGVKQPAEAISGTYADDGNVAHHPFDTIINGFIDAIIKNKKPPSDFSEALVVYKTIFALEKSFRTGKVVKVNK
jgi:predicted dehydrogenase